ncbi:MAG: hypothetical protein LBR52_06995 [Prevotellaceae bacterium]|nr:hypothetical protein [Prevotellaceae bacterium]
MNETEQQENLSDKDIFTKIWTSPGNVFKYINEKEYEKQLVMLLVLAGIVRAFDQASSKNMGDSLHCGEFFCFLSSQADILFSHLQNALRCTQVASHNH